MRAWRQVSARQYLQTLSLRDVACWATVTSYGEGMGPGLWLLRYGPEVSASVEEVSHVTGRVWLGAFGADAEAALRAASTHLNRIFG